MQNKSFYVGFEVLTVIIKKSSVFWNIVPYSLVKLNWCFKVMCPLHLQSLNISQAGNQHEAGSKKCSVYCLFHTGFLLGLLLTPEDGVGMFLQNVSWLSRGYIEIYPRRLNSVDPFIICNLFFGGGDQRTGKTSQLYLVYRPKIRK
jgi:hypothetical protein